MLFLFVMLPGFLPAQDGKSVMAKSPFLPPGFGRETKTTETSATPQQGPLSREFEFRGVFQSGDSVQLSIFDRTTNKSRWIGLNEAGERYTVVNYDPEDRSIMVRAGGRQEKLPLMQATDTPVPVGNARAEPAAGGSSNNATPTASPSTNQAAPNAPVVPRRRILRRTTGEGGDGQGGAQPAVPQRQSAAG